MVSAKSLAPGVLARDDWLYAVAVEEGHLPCRGRPDRGGLRRWVPAAVVSHHGRGVLDLASGNVLARDRQETGAWFDAARRAALGIGPLDGAWIGVCGLAGGQLPGATADGWQARASGVGVTVSAPGRAPLVVSESEEMRAFGFSPDGTTFIIAT